MSITALEGGLESSGDEDSALLLRADGHAFPGG